MNASVEKGFSQSNKSAMRNPWVIGMIGMIVVVLAVNVAFITTAFVTNPGLVNEDYYEQGRSYEKEINKKQIERSNLGWQLNFATPEAPRLGQAAPYRLVVTDKLGRPLKGAEVSIHAFRPSNAKDDFQVVLSELTDGIYEARISFPLKGIWDLIITVKQADGGWDMARRISVLAP